MAGRIGTQRFSKESALQQHDQRTKQSATSHDPADRIGVPYIDKHFVREEKVIDRYRIEARFEFVKKVILSHKPKKEHCPAAKQGYAQNNSMELRGVPTARQEREPEQQRECDD